jgi:hypothetical protein
MLLSCLGWGVYNVTNRYFLEDINWLVVLAWMWIGSGIYACGAFLLQPNQRAMMIDVLQKTDARRILSLFIVQALLDILAFSCFIKALQQAPVAGLVPTIGGTQAFFIFLIAGVFGYFFPSTFYKTKSSSIMIWRLLCIVVLFIGVMILSLL